MWVQSLALLIGLRIRHCCELWRRLQTRLGPPLLWLWCRLVATAPIQPLVWEPPYAMGVVLKRKRQKSKGRKEERKKERWKEGRKERKREKGRKKTKLLLLRDLSVSCDAGSRMWGPLRGLCQKPFQGETCEQLHGRSRRMLPAKGPRGGLTSWTH